MLVATLVSLAAWLPFLDGPLSADESGFLLLGQHWGPGSSLYGSYWVDRPPLLLWLFSLAGHLGSVATTSAGVSAPAVRLLGALASAVAVVLAALVSRLLASDSRSRQTTTMVVAALLCSPLFGMGETDGEILAAPFVLLGLTALIRSFQLRPTRRSMALAAGAGAAGMCAALVKQNIVDVFVFAVVLVLVSRGRDRSAWARLGVFAGGGLVVLLVAAVAATLRGTSPAGLWDALITFRLQAGAAISSSASPATAARFDRLVLAFVVSGAAMTMVITSALVLGAWRRRLPGRRGSVTPAPLDLTWPTLALVAWELCGVALGGSYWLHYLTGLVPGLVLLLSLARPSRRWVQVLNACAAYTVVASLVIWAHHLVADHGVSSDAKVAAYLRAHGASSDGVVVAFGHPDIVAGSGMTSPYPLLWSLPVRVRDPHLHHLKRVLAGPDSPRWVVVAGDSLGSWGIEPGRAQRYLTSHYAAQAAYGSWHVWRRL